MKKSIMIVLILGILIIGGVAIVLMNRSSNDNDADDKATTSSTTSSDTQGTGNENAQTNDTAVIAATITYGNSGFSPSSVTVKAGDTIKVVNSSDNDLDMESDPHPVHTDNTELNIGAVASGSSTTFKVSNKGTWGYHNHENENEKGTIIVQ